MNDIGITTDCVCDLPDEYLKLNDIEVVYFYIQTETGRFKDGIEITSGNVLEYLENGGKKVETAPPAPEEYKEFFLSQLKMHEQIVHFSISDKASRSYRNAIAARKLLGESGGRIRIIDSEHLSTGMGHMVIKAVEMRNSGCSTDEIAAEAERMKPLISTTFITMNADYLFKNGRMNKAVKSLCNTFSLHPVLGMKNGRIKLKGIMVGNYEKSVIKYIKGELKHNSRINKKRLFITHAGCTVKLINAVKAKTEKLCRFDEILVTKSSATISSNCGMGTVGVLFVREQD